MLRRQRAVCGVERHGCEQQPLAGALAAQAALVGRQACPDKFGCRRVKLRGAQQDPFDLHRPLDVALVGESRACLVEQLDDVCDTPRQHQRGAVVQRGRELRARVQVAIERFSQVPERTGSARGQLR
jgi:hypothetical protein